MEFCTFGRENERKRSSEQHFMPFSSSSPKAMPKGPGHAQALRDFSATTRFLEREPAPGHTLPFFSPSSIFLGRATYRARAQRPKTFPRASAHMACACSHFALRGRAYDLRVLFGLIGPAFGPKFKLAWREFGKYLEFIRQNRWNSILSDPTHSSSEQAEHTTVLGRFRPFPAGIPADLFVVVARESKDHATLDGSLKELVD